MAISWVCRADLAIERSCTVNLVSWGRTSTLARHTFRAGPPVYLRTEARHGGTGPGRSSSIRPMKVSSGMAVTSGVGHNSPYRPRPMDVRSRA
jgi:hypothetical protein